MDIVANDLVEAALSLNAKNAVIAEVTRIPFSPDFRKLCEENTCGAYDKNWMCPPAVGSISDLIERVKGFEQGLLFQTVHYLEDSFDWEGMIEGQANHEKVFRNILEYVEKNRSFTQILPLSAGPCAYCEKCAYTLGKKCNFPDKAVSSVEAHGINVMAMLKEYGIPYSHGQNSVSYVALILFE
jgi:predicted metal-binding protein